MERYSVSSSTGGRGHGRLERRTIKATEVDAGLGFPHACQVLQVRRTATRNDRKTVEVVYLITSMPMTSEAPSQVAAWIRGHWAIENHLHGVRDVTFDEDRSTSGTTAVTRTGRSTYFTPSDMQLHDFVGPWFAPGMLMQHPHAVSR